jgi:hypothetical protein
MATTAITREILLRTGGSVVFANGNIPGFLENIGREMIQPIPDHHLGLVGVANEIKRFIQNKRKELGCEVTETVRVYLCPEEDMMSAISVMKEILQEETKSLIEYDWSLEEKYCVTVDLDERLQYLPKGADRRKLPFGFRIERTR